MVGAFISTLNVRLTSQGLADIRGALGVGFDEGSWVSTIFSAAQMVVTPAAAWMSTVLSTRRVLLWTGAVFPLASVPSPLVHDYDPTYSALSFRKTSAARSRGGIRRPGIGSGSSGRTRR